MMSSLTSLLSDDANFDLEWLLVNSDTELDSSMELGEHPDSMIARTQARPPDPDSPDRKQTEPRQGGFDINI